MDERAREALRDVEERGKGREGGCKVLKPARERGRGDCKNIAWLEMLHLPVLPADGAV